VGNLTYIEAQHFLSLGKVRVDLGPLNVLVGPNGAGKTNLLRTIELLGEIARTDLVPAVNHFGGFNVAWLAEASPEVFEVLVDDLRYITPGFTQLRLVPLGGSSPGVSIEIEEKGLRGTTPLASASFGTIRALALLAMLHDPDPPKLTCVEEVDHGLHPYALDRIVERLRDASTRTQVLAATHSPALVNRLGPDELIVCERDPETGASRIPAIAPADVRKMYREDELRLGELWFSGALGGVI